MEYREHRGLDPVGDRGGRLRPGRGLRPRGPGRVRHPAAPGSRPGGHRLRHRGQLRRRRGRARRGGAPLPRRGDPRHQGGLARRGPAAPGTRRRCEAACRRSLQRLGTDRIDLLQVHFDDPGTPVEETVAALEGLRAEGLIRHYGVGHLPAHRVARYLEVGEPFSILMELSAAARESRRTLLPLCGGARPGGHRLQRHRARPAHRHHRARHHLRGGRHPPLRPALPAGPLRLRPAHRGAPGQPWPARWAHPGAGGHRLGAGPAGGGLRPDRAPPPRPSGGEPGRERAGACRQRRWPTWKPSSPGRTPPWRSRRRPPSTPSSTAPCPPTPPPPSGTWSTPSRRR